MVGWEVDFVTSVLEPHLKPETDQLSIWPNGGAGAGIRYGYILTL